MRNSRPITGFALLALFVLATFPVLISARILAGASRQNENTGEQGQTLPGPTTTRSRRIRRERRRRHHRGIRGHYKAAGISAGRGAARFGKNVAHGRVVRGGKELGKGMGGFGKHTGIATAKVGKRVGKTTANVAKRVATP